MKFDDTARFFEPSEKLWPELFATAGKAATMLCRDCRKVVVEGIRRYCTKCLSARQRKAKRESARRRRSNVDKTANSLIRVEALTHAEATTRCNPPQTSLSGPESSTE